MIVSQIRPFLTLEEKTRNLLEALKAVGWLKEHVDLFNLLQVQSQSR